MSTPAPDPTLPVVVHGGCHCGAVRIRVIVRSLEATECNCSICTKKGYLHLIVPADDLEWVSGRAEMSEYRFNTGVAVHMFCSTCGMHPVYRPRSHPDGWSVNVRCLDEPWPSRFRISPFDGRNWEQNIERIR